MNTLTQVQPPSVAAPAPAGPCRLCQLPAYGGDARGPVHACCYEWRAVIAAGFSCPACDAARQSRSYGRTRPPVRLPRQLPDGRPLVPGLPVSAAEGESAA